MLRRLIFLTGDVVGQETREFLEQTGAPHLTKPFTLEALRLPITRAGTGQG